MRRLVFIVAVAILVPVLTPFAVMMSHHAGASNEDEEHEPTHLVRHGNRTTSCGVERWNMKTGMDSGAKRVNLQPVSTNIIHLRSLPALAPCPQPRRRAALSGGRDRDPRRYREHRWGH
jgi:hypothetical protein